MSDLQDVNIIHDSPIKTGPGVGDDIDFVVASPEQPYGPIAIVLPPVNSPTGKPWVRINGHWKQTGLNGWVEQAHTQPVGGVPPTPPPPVPGGDHSTLDIDWVNRTVTVTPK